MVVQLGYAYFGVVICPHRHGVGDVAVYAEPENRVVSFDYRSPENATADGKHGGIERIAYVVPVIEEFVGVHCADGNSQNILAVVGRLESRKSPDAVVVATGIGHCVRTRVFLFRRAFCKHRGVVYTEKGCNREGKPAGFYRIAQAAECPEGVAFVIDLRLAGRRLAFGFIVSVGVG